LLIGGGNKKTLRTRQGRKIHESEACSARIVGTSLIAEMELLPETQKKKNFKDGESCNSRKTEPVSREDNGKKDIKKGEG